MKLPVMPISTCAKAAITSLFLVMTVPSAAQSVLSEEPDAMDVARTPLQDFNIDTDPIPEVLVKAMRDPYASEGLRKCNAIRAEIAELDRVMGADFDIAKDEDATLSEGRVAKSIVGMVIPFRGLVREISGANAKEREYNLALTAGFVRRSYLKGLGHGRGCAYPARPRAERGTFRIEE